MKKCAFVSIIGKPNSGKSTLLNTIIGQKISIVTHKVQTTRSIINGIYTEGNNQLIFLDTPGIFEPGKTLEKAMVRCAWSSIVGTDFVCLLLDVNNIIDNDKNLLKILRNISSNNVNLTILINKIDLLKGDVKSFLENISNKSNEPLNSKSALELIENQNLDCIKLVTLLKLVNEHYPLAPIFFTSGKTRISVDKFLLHLISKAQPRDWYYSEDQITTAPLRFIAQEITREQSFLALEQELPYNLTVETDKWEDISDDEVKIYQSIIVSRAAHKKIILGKNGLKIKEISMKSRQEIERTLDFKAHLFVFVKVRENWDEKSHYYQAMGLSFPKN